MPPHRSRRRIPEATVARLPVYLQVLADQSAAGVENMSSEELAELAGRVLDGELADRKSVKEAIRGWRADHQRI